MDCSINIDPGIAYTVLAVVALVTWLRYRRTVRAGSTGAKS